MTRYRITHTTRYSYSRSVSLCHSEAHLTPRPDGYQQLVAASLATHPPMAVRLDRQDFFGNRTTYFSIQESHQALDVTATSEVAVSVDTEVAEPDTALSWEETRDAIGVGATETLVEARQFTLDSPFVSAMPELSAYAEPSFAPGRPVLQGVRELMSRIYGEFAYDPHFSTVATPVGDVLAHRRGVCQDFAHLAIGCLRSLGLAARYVSGYLETEPPPGQPKLQGADASHAWLAVFVPELGWVDFDPTNDQRPAERHITLAWGRDYADVTPLKGVLLGGGDHDLTVAVDVERLEG